MSELREECYKCLNNQTCPSCADYGSIICMTKRKYEMPKNREDSVYATRFAVMQQQINEKDKRIKELEEYIAIAPNSDKMTATKYINIQREAYIKGRAEEQQKAEDIINKNYIPKQKVKEKIEEYDRKMTEDKGHPNWVVTDRIVMNVLEELLENK